MPESHETMKSLPRSSYEAHHTQKKIDEMRKHAEQSNRAPILKSMQSKTTKEHELPYWDKK